MFKFTNLLDIISALSLVDQNITKEKIPLENNLSKPTMYSVCENLRSSLRLCLQNEAVDWRGLNLGIQSVLYPWDYLLKNCALHTSPGSRSLLILTLLSYSPSALLRT